MDWGKAKNILIIALVITNVFLIYNIEKDMFESNISSMVKEENIQDVLMILEENNIKVKAEVPRTVLELSVLNVEYEIYEEEKLEKIFNKEEDTQIDLSVINNKIIRYENDNENMIIQDLNEKKAKDEAEAFISKYGFMTNDVDYWETTQDIDGYHVLFKQKYQDRFLEYSYMQVTVNRLGIKKFERMWLKPLDTDSNKKEIIPATKALLKCMYFLNTSDEEVVIKDVALGYWFDPSHISLTNSENIKSGTAFPAWRILLEDGQTKFVAAYENY
ncbi:two-component system regulatory protein YycI [Marinisporobacter balticus]|uniref:Regulatory protein YycI of two-component signal transduction system YycFG n=1 Tax=Marinisporobacter balticus TaxID=2018667 RepID=A0A4R2KVH4_9FIRM|nr:two-component system regulatory protein YycI [Marinisporobacter balticus]TCO77934.1 regulatory protein YycI of two-component signal transduction system YycFG [Marinisporobacter balticus]